MPVLLGDARTGACAAVHAGWRGTLAEIVKHALASMRDEFGTEARDVRAAIGPAALACCYEVGHEVIESFRAKFSNADSLFTPTREGHALADIQGANRRQLVESGVAPERIHSLPLCTICRPELFFSYRRDKKLYGRTGRLLSVIGLRISDCGFDESRAVFRLRPGSRGLKDESRATLNPQSEIRIPQSPQPLLLRPLPKYWPLMWLTGVSCPTMPIARSSSRVAGGKQTSSLQLWKRTLARTCATPCS